MAVAFDSVGPSAAGAGNNATATLSWTHTVVAGGATTGILVYCAVDVSPDTGVTATAKIDGVLMTSLGVVHANNGTGGFLQAWWTLGVATGARTILITPSVTPDDLEGGSVAVTSAGGIGPVFTGAGSSTTATVTLTTTHTGGLCIGGVGVGDNVNSATAPSTSRFIINQRGSVGDAVGNAAGATSPSTGSSVTMAWANNTASYAAIAAEVLPAPVTASDPRYAIPGRTWLRYFRKPQYANQQPPGPVMTQANAQTATATGAALGATTIIQSLAVQPPAYPGPAWKKHFQNPQQTQLSGPPPLAFGNAQTATATGSASLPSFVPYITSITPDPHGHFIDQYGNPRLYFATVPWGMPANAGRWNGGNWQSDFDTYFADIKAQGITAAEMHPWGHSHTGCNNDLGNTWDGVSPWTTLPTLNNTFWQRIDYLVSSAAAQGVTIFLVLNMQCDMGVDAFVGTGVFNGTSTANVKTACQNIAARYVNQPNLIFFQGDDYSNDDDTRMQAMVDGLRLGGYTGPTGVEEYSSGTTSRRDLSGSPTGTPFVFGGANATFNWCYYYNVTYFAVEQAYKELNQIPVVWGDGFYVNGGTTEPNDSHLMRNFVWWALASGARGVSMGSESILQWTSTAFTDVTGPWYANSAKNIYTAFTSLQGWQNLLPDLNNKLVTGGRGTRAVYTSQTFLGANLGTDNYVAASITPDGSLAVIYCAVAMTITIDQTQLGPGYTATWIDPASGATQAATPGSTFDSTPLGNNSATATDWVLVLQGPALIFGSNTAPALPGRTWLEQFRHQQQPLPAAPVVTFTNALAGVAAATVVALGQDNDATMDVIVAPNAGNAAATGTALGQDTGADIAMVSPNAALAPATGTARGQDTGDPLPGVSYPRQPILASLQWIHQFRHPQQVVPPAPFNVYPTTATATGTALGVDTGADIAMVSPNAGTAPATGTALGNDTGANEPSVTVNAGTASGVATALDASASLPAAAAQPAYPGGVWRHYFQHPQQPLPPAPFNVYPATATATGTALGQDTGADIAMVSPNAGNAGATGAAQGQDNGSNLAAVTVNANTAAATGAAGNVSTQAPATPAAQAYPGGVWRHYFQHPQQIPAAAPAPSVNAQAGLASATGTALGQDTGANIASVSPNAGNAGAAGTAQGQDTGANPASVTVNAGVAPATGAAQGPNPSVAVNAGLANGTGTAQQPGLLTLIPAPQQQAYPSPVWRRQFQHPQQWRPFVPPPPPFFQPATSTSTVTDPREGILAAAADGREGSASVRDLSEGSAVHN